MTTYEFSARDFRKRSEGRFPAQRAGSLYLLWAGTGHPVGRVTVSQAKLRVLQRRAFGLRPL